MLRWIFFIVVSKKKNHWVIDFTLDKNKKNSSFLQSWRRTLGKTSLSAHNTQEDHFSTASLLPLERRGEVQRYLRRGGGGKIKFREGNMSEYHACCWGELFWQRLDIFFYLWRRAMRSDGVKPIASLFKIRTPNNCGNIDDKARRGNCSERVWLKAHVRKAEAIKGLVYFKSEEDMLRAW